LSEHRQVRPSSIDRATSAQMCSVRSWSPVRAPKICWIEAVSSSVTELVGCTINLRRTRAVSVKSAGWVSWRMGPHWSE